MATTDRRPENTGPRKEEKRIDRRGDYPKGGISFWLHVAPYPGTSIQDVVDAYNTYDSPYDAWPDQKPEGRR